MTDFFNKIIAVVFAVALCYGSWNIYLYLRDYLDLSPFQFMKWYDQAFVIFVVYLAFSLVWASFKMLIVVFSGRPRPFGN